MVLKEVFRRDNFASDLFTCGLNSEAALKILLIWDCLIFLEGKKRSRQNKNPSRQKISWSNQQRNEPINQLSKRKSNGLFIKESRDLIMREKPMKSNRSSRLHLQNS